MAKDPAWLKSLKKEIEDNPNLDWKTIFTKYKKEELMKDKKAKTKMQAAKGGMAKKKMMGGGMAKKKPTGGLKKLPKAVRNKMGYMNKGGMAKKKAK